jgi:hypothetical protein
MAIDAMDCTQDASNMSLGTFRELMNGIQQLRKNAGLELKDAWDTSST